MTFLGVLMSLYLTRQHIAFASGEDVSAGICKVFKVFDCSAIEASRFSEVVGIPTASFGLFYFLTFLAYLVMARPKDREVAFWPIVALFSLIGLLTSLTLASISALIIRGFCAGCTIVYFIALTDSILAVRRGVSDYLGEAIAGIPAAWREIRWMFGDAQTPETARARKIFLTMIFAVAPINFATPVYLIHRVNTRPVLDKYFAQPVQEFRTDEGTIQKGPADAPIQIVVFVDFDCPFCRAFQIYFAQILSHFPENSYRLIYKLYPIGKCNPIVKDERQFHPHACQLAELAQALADMGKFWGVEAEFYQFIRQTEIYGGLKEISIHAGVEYLDWIRQKEDPKVREQVNEDIREGNKLEIVGLPSVFVNGRYVDSLRPPQKLELVLKIAEREGKSPKQGIKP